MLHKVLNNSQATQKIFQNAKTQKFVPVVLLHQEVLTELLLH